MQALITSYLIQKKECDLPLLGHFRIKTKPADFEKINKRIFPPTDEILYSEFAARLSPGLLSYISRLENITPVEAEAKINSWCLHAKEKIDLGEKITFDSMGTLQKDAVGNIFFQRKSGFNFFEPVSAERIQKNDAHPIVVGDTETTSTVMQEFYKQEKVQNWERWKMWSIILLAISLVILAFHFYMHRFSQTGIGNRASLSTESPPASYHFR
ncbi:MAG: hypothetical protein ABI416_13030 [Ginsengibacter sp.]